MQLKLSLPFIITFLLLLLVMMELHEIVHITVGRLICGCWGTRDFNVWSLGAGCAARESLGWLATLAGPLFSFAMMWLGMYWLSSPRKKLKVTGFAVIFANIPFGRITTVMMGGGDEMVVIRHFMKDDFSRTSLIIGGTLIVLLAGVPPVLKAWKTLENKLSWAYIIGFLTVPLLFLLTYLLTGMNTVLSHGFLATSWIMGTPLLITIHTIITATLLVVLRKHLVQAATGSPVV